ncbi:enoyl-CoA hydratase-related protein [Aquibium sp. A9E412]|uniref:enoyl-CoA hydratase-related protein n=1 Tax=Aquibium sp. A9E412 TaxID=2976767 RepID=UPI0025B1739D|nr:enoyl-CoA hydratase-related protein [Aquibium sp. A9E412]MDN2568175.1 enoyl-CoA hydratase-related protein [Aquibium sp. A9E412]
MATGGSHDNAILLETRAGVATLTLNRPDKMNALSHAMWTRLTELVETLSADPAVRVIVLTGTGAHFCAGADIAEFDTLRASAAGGRAYEAANAAAFAALRNAARPTLAAIRGTCFGGGFGLAAACDLRLAAQDAVFAVPAARLGLGYPPEAMADIVAAVGSQMARYLTYSGERLDARGALAAGFVLETVAGEALAKRADALAATIAANAPLSIRASKAAIAAALSGAPEDAERARALGEATFDSADYAEGRAAFKARRAPRFTGA